MFKTGAGAREREEEQHITQDFYVENPITLGKTTVEECLPQHCSEKVLQLHSQNSLFKRT